MLGQHFHQEDPNAGLEGRTQRKIGTAREKEKVAWWQCWQRGRTPLTIIGCCICSCSQEAAVFAAAAKRLWWHLEMYTRDKWKKGKTPDSVGDQPEGGNVVQQKGRTAGPERPGFKCRLSQFLTVWLQTGYVICLGLSCVVCKIRMTMTLMKYNS